MKMDSRASAECQNWEKKDVNVIFGIVKLEKDKIINSVCLLQNSKGGKREMEHRSQWAAEMEFLERERLLLSKIPGDPTVGSRRDKKGSCSMRRGLRVGTGFREFSQTPRGRGFSLLGFYTLFKCFSMFGWFKALNGHLIGSKS